MIARRTKHRPGRPPPAWSYVYDGRDLFAVVEAKADGWHVRNSDGTSLGVFESREFALAFVNASIASPPAAAIPGERERDLGHLKIIRQHRKIEREQRARRAVGSKR